MKHTGILVVLAALLAGCATADPSGAQYPWLAAVNPVRSDNDRLLDYHARLAQLKPQELTKEYESVRKDYEAQKGDVRRIQLAMLLSMPGATFRDDSAALALLQTWTRDKRTAESPLRPIAVLIQNYLQDLRRAEEATQSQAAKLRDEQRRAEALQQKLEALLEMEMKMIEREQAIQPKKR